MKTITLPQLKKRIKAKTPTFVTCSNKDKDRTIRELEKLYPDNGGLQFISETHAVVHHFNSRNIWLHGSLTSNTSYRLKLSCICKE